MSHTDTLRLASCVRVTMILRQAATWKSRNREMKNIFSSSTWFISVTYMHQLHSSHHNERWRRMLQNKQKTWIIKYCGRREIFLVKKTNINLHLLNLRLGLHGINGIWTVSKKINILIKREPNFRSMRNILLVMGKQDVKGSPVWSSKHLQIGRWFCVLHSAFCPQAAIH